MRSDAFKELDFVQELDLDASQPLRTTRCPIRLDGRLPERAERFSRELLSQGDDRVT